MVAKLTIQKIRELAKERGGACLSMTYVNAVTKLRWRCAEGHEWKTTANAVQQGAWCPTCGVVKRGLARRLSIEQMQVIAKKHGGQCLSTHYVNNRTKLLWKCAEGHKWEATPSSVNNADHWCPTCNGNPTITIEDMQAVAKERGGQCLSTHYVNNHAKLRWRCAKGHEWEAVSTKVKNGGRWCPRCGRKDASDKQRLTIDQMQELAKDRGGKCLSTSYRKATTKLLWRCAEGHEWRNTPNNVRNHGQWCPTCAGRPPLTLGDMHAVAKERGGQCLSKSYVSQAAKLRWKCAEGHEWEATGGSIRYNGSWCPACGQGNSERIVRDIFEQMFGRRFPKARPRWLTSARGGHMELDGYSKSLSLAFEYQGKQHYERLGNFQTTAVAFTEQQRRDRRKRRLCKAQGITLFSIPYTVALPDVPSYVAKRVARRGLAVKMKAPETVTVADFVLPERLREMRALAQERGGECLSTAYIAGNVKLRWRCSEGHEWDAAPGNLRQHGSWCPTCGGKEKLTLDEMQAMARDRGGVCLSPTYVNEGTKLRWRCAEGHEWDAVPGNLRQHGSWCPKCAGLAPLTLDEMQRIAKHRGGVCLSTTYVNYKEKLRWRCSEGHEWEANANRIKGNGSWCSKCARSRRRGRAPA